MIRRVIKAYTNVFKPPRGWDAEEDGSCSDLHVRITGDQIFQSAWEPTPKELEIINNGGSIVLTVWGGQPPVALTVESQ